MDRAQRLIERGMRWDGGRKRRRDREKMDRAQRRRVIERGMRWDGESEREREKIETDREGWDGKRRVYTYH